MDQYTDLRDWELLQNPDTIPDVASFDASGAGVNHDNHGLGSGVRGQETSGGETGLEVKEGGLEEKGGGDLLADLGGSEVLLEEESGTEVDPSAVELGGTNEESGDSQELQFSGQSEVGIKGVEISLENPDGGGNLGKAEETNGISDAIDIDEEAKTETDISGIVEEIEANTDSSEWDFVRSSDSSPRSEFTGGRNEENGEPIAAGNGNKSGFVWWKMPLQLVKFCVFNVRPIWSISVAAAMLGFALIGQRWYNMKRRRIPARLDINDKKASQSVARASRLNEAFFLVKRVPVLQTSVSNSTITPRPAMVLIS